MDGIKKGVAKKLAFSVFCIFCQISTVYGFARVIRLKTASGAYGDETVIRLEQESTFSFDSNWDAYKFTNLGNTPNFYTFLDGTSYSINSVPMSFDEYSFDLHLKVGFSGMYTITSTSLLNSADDSLEIILEDKLLQKTQLLYENSVYEFEAAVTDSSARFVLHYKFIRPKISSNTSARKNTIDIKVLPEQLQIELGAEPSEDASIVIIDMTGKIIYLNEEVLANSTTEIYLDTFNSNSIYFIRVIAGKDGLCKKVMF
jgi:hypothetical protein